MTEKYLEGQVAIVTGGMRGIGLGIARRLHERGAKVAIWDRETPAWDQAAKGFSPGLVVKADVSDARSVEKAFRETMDLVGRVDILVNNAGIGGYRPFLDWTEDDYDKIMATNAKSTWLYCKEVIPHLLKQGGGNIVNISSVAGLQGYPSEGIYCMSKFAQVALSQSLDREFYQKNIKVSLVCPGGVETHFAIGDGRTYDGANMKGFSAAEEIAEAVVLAVLPMGRSRIVNVIMRPMNEMT